MKAIWRNKQVVIEATKMPFDRAELHFAEEVYIKIMNLKVRIEFFLSILLLCKQKRKTMVNWWNQKGLPR